MDVTVYCQFTPPFDSLAVLVCLGDNKERVLGHEYITAITTIYVAAQVGSRLLTQTLPCLQEYASALRVRKRFVGNSLF